MPAGGARLFGDVEPEARALVQISQLVLKGRIALLEHRPDDAAIAFRAAAERQETVLHDFDDPPAWWYPVRRSLAAAELAAGQPEAAEREAQAALALAPQDPLALLVLGRARQARGKAALAEQALAEARRAWRGPASELALANV